MELLNILRFIWNHPLSNGGRLKAVGRFTRWQIGARLLGAPAIFPWINGTRLIVKKGMASATGNIYVGLMEFEEMAFVLHYLRPEDLFFDIGANIGAYTVLAAGAAGARCVSIEPVPATFGSLLDNINLNRITHRTTALNIGVASSGSTLSFTASADSINHVATAEDASAQTIRVDVRSLDHVSADYGIPDVIKIDVEGFEHEVVEGGAQVFGGDASANVVLMELRGHGARYGFREKDIHAKMLGYGYLPCEYQPMGRVLTQWCDPENGRFGDMLYIKDITRVKERLRTAHTYSVFNKAF